MRLTTRCPACGKKVRYDGGEADGQGVCPACGAAVAFPPPPQLDRTPPDESAEPDGLTGEAAAAPRLEPVALFPTAGVWRPVGPAVVVEPLAPPVPAPRRAGWWAAAGMVGVAAVVVAAVVVTRRPEPPGRPRVVAAVAPATRPASPSPRRFGADTGKELTPPRAVAPDPSPRVAAVPPPVFSAPGREAVGLVAPPAETVGAVRPQDLIPSSAAPPVLSTPEAPVAVRPPPAGPRPAPARPADPPPPRPAPKPVIDDAGRLTDEEIGRAIQKGVEFVQRQFDPATHLLRRERGPDRGRGDFMIRNDNATFAGMDALAVYALLQCGQAVNDPQLNVRSPAMRAKLEALKGLPMDGHPQTYARALRATCLALFDRPEDVGRLKEDGEFLLNTSNDGAYGYGAVALMGSRDGFGRGRGINQPGWWDNSNSQYGLLGVWSAADAEPSFEVPVSYWRAVERHWTQFQLPSGEWGYTANQSAGRNTMTAAGIASLFVTHEYLDPAVTSARVGENVGRDPFGPALRKALEWFEREDHSTDLSQVAWWGYALYGVERVGLASGFKHFGTHDWYRELAAEVVQRQDPAGGWAGRGGVVDTSYALLFLSRGRHPIMMSKLRLDRRGDRAVAYWANRPRDLANVARFAGRQLERPLNWQVVSLDTPWTEWTDSPILYVASHVPPKLTDADYDKMRAFVRAGGMIFTHADTGAPKFNDWAAELARKLFPAYELADLPPDHPIYNVVFRPSPQPPLKAVSNGARVLMVHSPTDLALRWQQRQDRAWEGGRKGPSDLQAKSLAPFHLGVNLFVYAAGKRDLRNRIDSPWVPPVASAPAQTIKVARLRYAGNWDPEPAAWERLANWFHRQTGYGLDVRPVTLRDLKPGDAPFAHLTGTARQGFAADEVAALKRYVEAGGVVLMDTCGGTGPFDADVRALVTGAFPTDYPTAVGPAHPLLTPSRPGMTDVARPILRPFTVERLGGRAGGLNVVTAGRGHVLLAPLDVTSGLLGTGTWGILGYDPAYCLDLVRNALFWTIDGQAETADSFPVAPAEASGAAASPGGAG